MISQFPLHQFRLALSNNSKLKAELQPFLLQFGQNNMQWIFAAVSELLNNLQNPKIETTTTFNSLLAVKFILDSANVVVAHCIETYLLPSITSIASYQIQSSSEKRGESYFISRGISGNREQLKTSGYNFVHVAEEIVKSSTQIKPKVLCFNEEVQQASQFSQALFVLKRKGLQTYKSFMFYEVSILKETRISFLKSLQRYNKENAPFKLFFENFAKQYLSQGTEAKGNVSPFKLLEKGEATAIQAVVRECIKSLKSVDLRQRTRALRLMSDLVRWGDITVAYQINSDGTIGELVREIADPKEKCLGFDRATKVLKKYQITEQHKIQYYKELLKSIKFWSKCYSTAINSIDRVSNVKLLCGKLQRQGIHFPDYQTIFTDEAIYEQNRKKKQKLNQKLVMRHQKKQNEQRLSILNSYIDLASPTLPETKPLLEKVSNQIQKVRNILSNIGQSQERMPEYIQTLNRFYKQFDLNIHRGKFVCKDLYSLINQGMPLMDAIEQIMPLLQRYKSKTITFDALKASLCQRPLKFAQTQQPQRSQSFCFELPEHSYRHQLRKPKIDLTNSQDMTVEEIVKNKFQQYEDGARRRSTSSPDNFLISGFNMDKLMNTNIYAARGAKCIRMNKLETLEQFKEFQGNTLKAQHQTATGFA